MKFVILKDKNGNDILLKLHENQIYDSNGLTLADKLAATVSNISVQNDGVYVVKADGTSTKVATVGSLYSYNEATHSNNGLMSISDKIKLDSMQTNACKVTITKNNVFGAESVDSDIEIRSNNGTETFKIGAPTGYKISVFNNSSAERRVVITSRGTTGIPASVYKGEEYGMNLLANEQMTVFSVWDKFTIKLINPTNDTVITTLNIDMSTVNKLWHIYKIENDSIVEL